MHLGMRLIYPRTQDTNYRTGVLVIEVACMANTCNHTGDGAGSQQGTQCAGVPEITRVIEGKKPVQTCIG